MMRKMIARQVPGEPQRQWITDDYFDLYIWNAPDGEVIGFQLCYDKGGDERAFTWRRNGPCGHHHVDSGNDGPYDVRSPMLTRRATAPAGDALQAEFQQRSELLEPELRALIMAALETFLSGRAQG